MIAQELQYLEGHAVIPIDECGFEARSDILAELRALTGVQDVVDRRP